MYVTPDSMFQCGNSLKSLIVREQRQSQSKMPFKYTGGHSKLKRSLPQASDADDTVSSPAGGAKVSVCPCERFAASQEAVRSDRGGQQMATKAVKGCSR